MVLAHLLVHTVPIEPGGGYDDTHAGTFSREFCLGRVDRDEGILERLLEEGLEFCLGHLESPSVCIDGRVEHFFRDME